MYHIRRWFFHSPGRYIAAFIICAVVAAFMLVTGDRGYSQNAWANALQTGGAVCFFFGLLVMVTFYGSFETFGYGVSALTGRKKYKDLYEYVKAKEEKRKTHKLIFNPYLLSGLIVFTSGMIVYYV